MHHIDATTEMANTNVQTLMQLDTTQDLHHAAIEDWSPQQVQVWARRFDEEASAILSVNKIDGKTLMVMTYRVRAHA